MTEQPLLIQLDRLSPKGTVFEGMFRPGDLENLAEDLASPDGELHYRVEGRLDSTGRRVISCIINGFVFLTCQSTFEVFRQEIAVDDHLVLVESEKELPAFEEESDSEDYVVATQAVDVRVLVEEAVILALPMVPRKPGLEAAPQSGAEPGQEKPSPFAALAGLKRPK
jgi:uncharacterized protein